MDIPLVDLQAQYAAIKPEIQDAINRILDNTSFILGDEVDAFEAAFAEFIGAKHAIGVSSGTAAVHLALAVAGVKPGDEVIVPANTFIATAEPIVYLGASPVLVDVDPVTYTMDLAEAEAAMTDKTSAIVPVHLFGHATDMDPILDMANERGLKVVEDAAQAHGAQYKGRGVGSIGDVACFSFYPGKNLGAYGDAGAVTTNDDDLAEQVRMLRNHGRASKYESLTIGYNARIDALQAAILAVKLRHLPDWNDARRRHAQAYNERLADLDAALPTEAEWAKHVYHIYAIQVDNRDDVLAKLKDRGIGAGIHYPVPLHMQPVFEHLGQGPFPAAERAAERMISLPLYAELTDEQIDYVCGCLADAL